MKKIVDLVTPLDAGLGRFGGLNLIFGKLQPMYGMYPFATGKPLAEKELGIRLDIKGSAKKKKKVRAAVKPQIPPGVKRLMYTEWHDSPNKDEDVTYADYIMEHHW